MSRQGGPIFQVERVPPELLRRAKARAAFEGQSMRGVFLAFLQEYATGRVTPKRDEDSSEPIAPGPAGAPRRLSQVASETNASHLFRLLV